MLLQKLITEKLLLTIAADPPFCGGDFHGDGLVDQPYVLDEVELERELEFAGAALLCVGEVGALDLLSEVHEAVVLDLGSIRSSYFSLKFRCIK